MSEFVTKYYTFKFILQQVVSLRKKFQDYYATVVDKNMMFKCSFLSGNGMIIENIKDASFETSDAIKV